MLELEVECTHVASELLTLLLIGDDVVRIIYV